MGKGVNKSLNQLVFIFALFISILFSISLVSAYVVTVCSSGCNYTDITSALITENNTNNTIKLNESGLHKINGIYDFIIGDYPVAGGEERGVIRIPLNNIILDCSDSTIRAHPTTSFDGSAIRILSNTNSTGIDITNITVQNCNLGHYYTAIDLSKDASNANNITIQGNTIFDTGSKGILVSGTEKGILLQNNTIFNSSFKAGASIFIKESAGVTIKHNNITADRGINLYSSLSDINIENNFLNNTISDFLLYSSSAVSLNNTFNRNKVDISGKSSNLTFKWYLIVNITNSSFSPLADANVSVYEKSTGTYNLEWNDITDINGLTPARATTEGVAYDGYLGENPLNWTPHNISATKKGYNPNSTTDTINISKTVLLILDKSDIPPEPLPDLIVKALLFSPMNPKINNTVNIFTVVKNIGEVIVNSSFCVDIDPGSGSPTIGFCNLHPLDIDPNCTNENRKVRNSTFEYNANGTYTVESEVDYAPQLINESNETNNILTKPIFIGDYDHDNIYNDADSDDDANGKDDSTQKVLGNATFVTAIDLTGKTPCDYDFDVSIEVDGSTDLSQDFSGIHNVTFKDGSNIIIEFSHDFSYAPLNLLDVAIEKHKDLTKNKSTIVTKGLNLTPGFTKTVYLEDTHPNGVICFVDKETVSISEISEQCNDPDEIKMPCTNNGHTKDNYTCTDIGDYLRLEGLQHSIIQQLICTDNDGDGYGENCNNGNDCDDSDGSKNTDCSSSSSSSSGGGEGRGGGGGGEGGGSIVRRPQQNTPTKTTAPQSVIESKRETVQIKPEETGLEGITGAAVATPTLGNGKLAAIIISVTMLLSIGSYIGYRNGFFNKIETWRHLKR